MPDEGVAANINLGSFDLDAWEAVLSVATGASLTDARVVSTPVTYLPTTVALRARDLRVGGRKFSNVVVGGSREGLWWRANLDASELNG